MDAQRPAGLVVEDDEDIAMLISSTLGHLDLRMSIATRAAAALTAARELDPVLVTVDLGLPDLDGTDLVAQIRATSQAYILVLSARSTPEDEAAALAAGADAFLSKPFSPRLLRETVDGALAASTAPASHRR